VEGGVWGGDEGGVCGVQGQVGREEETGEGIRRALRRDPRNILIKLRTLRLIGHLLTPLLDIRPQTRQALLTQLGRIHQLPAHGHSPGRLRLLPDDDPDSRHLRTRSVTDQAVRRRRESAVFGGVLPGDAGDTAAEDHEGYSLDECDF
jgi:hypothetical protein